MVDVKLEVKVTATRPKEGQIYVEPNPSRDLSKSNKKKLPCSWCDPITAVSTAFSPPSTIDRHATPWLTCFIEFDPNTVQFLPLPIIRSTS